MKHRLHQILEEAKPNDRVAHAFHLFISVLILANILAIMLDSVVSIKARFQEMFLWFEYLSLAIFTLEYTCRIWVCTEDERYRPPLLGRLRFVLTPLAVADLLAISPLFAPFISPDLRVVRTFRLVRLLRILKLGRYSEAFRLLGRAIRSRREQLVAVFTIQTVVLVVSSTLMYEAEHAIQPEKFSSIPATMWWAVETLTTLGYGDVVPMTPLGKLLGGVIGLLGIGMFALPTAVLGAGFMEQLQDAKATHIVCEHCGNPVEIGKSGCGKGL